MAKRIIVVVGNLNTINIWCRDNEISPRNVIKIMSNMDWNKVRGLIIDEVHYIHGSEFASDELKAEIKARMDYGKED